MQGEALRRILHPLRVSQKAVPQLLQFNVIARRKGRLRYYRSPWETRQDTLACFLSNVVCVKRTNRSWRSFHTII